MNAAPRRPAHPTDTSPDAVNPGRSESGSRGGATNTLADFERVTLRYLDDVARVAGVSLPLK